jgi:AcrR family transcriptional regulator
MEARRTKRREQLIAAGLEQFGTVGYDGTTVKAICEAAGLTERYFYEHFADRAALLAAVFEEVVGTVMSAAMDAADDAAPTPLARARAGLDGFLSALGDDPRRARIQLIEVVGRSEALERRRFDVMHQFVAYIERTASELDPSVDFERERWRHAVVLALVGGTNHLAIEWALGELTISKAELVDALVALYLAASVATVTRD